MRAIFLDVDGVLNAIDTKEVIPGTRYQGINLEKVKLLSSLVSQSSQVDKTIIVLSSSWRVAEDFYGNRIRGLEKYLRDCLMSYGLSVQDSTPMIHDGRKRGREILAWLSEHADVTGMVILDDLAHDFREMGLHPYLVKTSYEGGGLQEGDIEIALEKLRLKVPESVIDKRFTDYLLPKTSDSYPIKGADDEC